MERNFIIWIVLLVFSSFAFLTGFYDIRSGLFVAILLLSTFMKGFFVIENFMNLREVKIKYRLLPTLWLSAVIFFIAITYYM